MGAEVRARVRAEVEARVRAEVGAEVRGRVMSNRLCVAVKTRDDVEVAVEDHLAHRKGSWKVPLCGQRVRVCRASHSASHASSTSQVQGSVQSWQWSWFRACPAALPEFCTMLTPSAPVAC